MPETPAPSRARGGSQPVILLDRDGVINHDSPDYIRSPEEWIALPGALEGMASLHRAGWRLAIATNQSGIGRGLYSRATLERIHAKLRGELDAAGGCVESIQYCPHTPDDSCTCRKPAPGMLHALGRALEIELSGVPFVGDSLRDLQAARAAGCTPVLVRTGYGERTLGQLGAQDDDVLVVDSLAAYAAQLLAGGQS
ncbi:MAG: D-glycero-beta-D-manno-heptose 1,7-bisphosphate 7-phosphatase [Gammaproteobacteria bacterium AqS3]|nr:D-glycero-beta-D-manno-heptose 1,7-bisphosphate 7-phosphatase [Gammaproteobacteria bacterium AqS3]